MRPWPGGLPPSDGAVPWEERHLLPEDHRYGFDPYEYTKPRPGRCFKMYDVTEFEFVDPYPNAEEVLIAMDTVREALEILRDTERHPHQDVSARKEARPLEQKLTALISTAQIYDSGGRMYRLERLRTAIAALWPRRHNVKLVLLSQRTVREWLKILIRMLKELKNGSK